MKMQSLFHPVCLWHASIMFVSWEIIFEKSDAPGGLCPRCRGIPIAMAMYYLSQTRVIALRPIPQWGTGGARGGIFLFEKQFSPKLM
jgi:hypothetical protein